MHSHITLNAAILCDNLSTVHACISAYRNAYLHITYTRYGACACARVANARELPGNIFHHGETRFDNTG